MELDTTGTQRPGRIWCTSNTSANGPTIRTCLTTATVCVGVHIPKVLATAHASRGGWNARPNFKRRLSTQTNPPLLNTRRELGVSLTLMIQSLNRRVAKRQKPNANPLLHELVQIQVQYPPPCLNGAKSNTSPVYATSRSPAASASLVLQHPFRCPFEASFK